MMKLRLFSKKKIAHIRNMICTQTRFVSSGGRKQPTHRQTITMFLIPHRECPSTLHMCVHVCSYMCTVQGWTETTHVEDSCYNASIITTCLLYVLLYWHDDLSVKVPSCTKSCMFTTEIQIQVSFSSQAKYIWRPPLNSSSHIQFGIWQSYDTGTIKNRTSGLVHNVPLVCSSHIQVLM